jgi:aspartate 1-decarboxylase
MGEPMRIMLKSKIHRPNVTDVSIDYNGSITIDRKLMEAVDIFPFEQVHVLNIDNGARFVTYAIEDEEAHTFIPKLVYVDNTNAITETRGLAVTIPFKGGNRCA